VLQQCAMYVAALRLAHDFGCDAIGIQYQQGLKDLLPASDLVEGLLNDAHRPPVTDPATGTVLYEGEPLPHFNEVDEAPGSTRSSPTGCGAPSATTPPPPSTTSAGASATSGPTATAAPSTPSSGSSRSRAPPPPPTSRGATAPPAASGSRRCTSRSAAAPSRASRSRARSSGAGSTSTAAELHLDLGRASAVALPDAETERRWAATTPQWPIMHAVLHGVDRDQMMARHKANHVQVVYAPDAAGADRALAAKAAAFAELGVHVHLCGDVRVG
jgi:hypothetical protein